MAADPGAPRRPGGGMSDKRTMSERLSAALSDRYTIDRELGARGIGTVYLAQEIKHHRQVAVDLRLGVRDQHRRRPVRSDCRYGIRPTDHHSPALARRAGVRGHCLGRLQSHAGYPGDLQGGRGNRTGAIPASRAGLAEAGEARRRRGYAPPNGLTDLCDMTIMVI